MDKSDFSGGPAIKTLCFHWELGGVDTGSIPGQGTKIPHLLHRAANKYNSVVNLQIQQVSKNHRQERGT